MARTLPWLCSALCAVIDGFHGKLVRFDDIVSLFSVARAMSPVHVCGAAAVELWAALVRCPSNPQPLSIDRFCELLEKTPLNEEIETASDASRERIRAANYSLDNALALLE
jgi:hypothetical protein